MGKYITGALASLLIFIGAASFVAMVWNQIGDFMKFGILLGSGLLICAAGYYMFLKSPFEKNASSSIASIVFSTGAGLVYIAILSSSITLRLFSPFVSLVMCLIWSLALMFSYRFTDRFICIAIAYIGAFVNLSLGTHSINVFTDVLVLFFFITSVNLFMLYVTQKKRGREFRVCVFLAGFLYIGFLYMTGDLIVNDEMTEIASLLSLFGLKNLLFYLDNLQLQKNNTESEYFKLKSRAVLHQLLFAIGFSLSFFMCKSMDNLKDYEMALVMLSVFGGQFLINAYAFRHTVYAVNIYYSLIAYIGMIVLTGDFLKVNSGVIVLLLFILSKKLWKNDYNPLFLFLVCS